MAARVEQVGEFVLTYPDDSSDGYVLSHPLLDERCMEAIRRSVAAAPPPTREVLDRLRVLLAPVVQQWHEEQSRQSAA